MATRRVLKHVNKSDKASMRVEEAQLETDGESHRLPIFIKQRWSSVHHVYKRFLSNFDILQKYFNDVKIAFPWQGVLSKRLVQELFSVLKAINHVIKKSQSNEEICVVSFSLLQMAYFSLYKPLVIYDTEENIVEK